MPIIRAEKDPIHIITSIPADLDTLCGIRNTAEMDWVSPEDSKKATCKECLEAIPDFLKLETRLAQLIESGFDKSYITSDHTIRLGCSSCEALSINGIACHETGCPNVVKDAPEDEDDHWGEVDRAEIRSLDEQDEEGDYTPFQPDE